MGRGRRENERNARRRVDPRLRRLSYEERRRVYRRRRIGALLVLGAILLALLVLAGLLPFLGSASAGGTPESETARAPKISISTLRAPVETLEAPEAPRPTADAGTDEEATRKSGEEAGEPLDILFLGVDERPEDDFVEGSRADTIMLARVFPKTGEVRLLSIPRDLFVEIEPGVQDRVNAAYAYGGVEQTTEAVERATGISVDHYAVVDFEGFVDTVDALGGVRVEILDEMPPGRKMEGVQTLNGKQALFYARYRGTPGGDLDRIERQQQIIAALRGELLSWETVTKLPELVESVRTNVETDLGFKENLSLARLLFRGDDARITTGQLRGAPVTLVDGRQVLLPQPEDNQALLEEFHG